MTLHYLHNVAQRHLPVVVTSTQEIDDVRSLVSGGLLKAVFDTSPALGQAPTAARIVHITALGRRMMGWFPPDRLGEAKGHATALC